MFTSAVADTTGLDSASKATLAQEKLDKDLNQFLNMLVAQLQNQDPLDPMDANEFTSQLVQFASVEQQIYSNANLEKLVGLQQTSQVSSMVNYLGTIIEANGQAFNLDQSSAKFSYDLESGAAETTITIHDALDREVWTGGGSTDPGKQFFVWDGLKNDGTQVPDGPYTAIVSAKDPDGNLINVAQTVFGRVTGAGATEGNVTLSMGAVDASPEDIVNVQEAPAAAAAVP